MGDLETKEICLLLDEFIEEKEGSWNHEDWQVLKKKINIDESELGKLLEIEKQKYIAVKDNIKLLSKNVLIELCKGFIMTNDANWNHEDWVKFKETVKEKGDFIELELGYILEEQKSIFLDNNHSFASELDILKRDLARRDSHIAELNFLIESLKHQKNRLESEIISQKALEEDIVKSKQKIAQEKEVLEKNNISLMEYEKLKKEKNEIEARYESLQKVKSLQREALLLKDKAIDTLNIELERLKSLSTKNFELEKNLSDYNRSKADLLQKENSIRSFQKTIEVLNSKVKEQDSNVRLISEENKKLSDSVKIKDSVLKTLEKEMKTLRDESRLREQEYEKKIAELDDAEERLKEFGKNITKDKIEIHKRSLELTTKEPELLKQEKEIESGNERLTAKEIELKSLDSKIKETKASLDLLANSIEKRTKKLEIKEDEITAAKKEAENLRIEAKKELTTISKEKIEFEKKKNNLFQKLDEFEKLETMVIKKGAFLSNKETFLDKKERLIQRHVLILAKEKRAILGQKDLLQKENDLISRESKNIVMIQKGLASREESLKEKETKIIKTEIEIENQKKKLADSFRDIEMKEKELNRLKYHIKNGKK